MRLSPPTPPDIRVRIRRFAGLSGNSCCCCRRSLDGSNRRASFDSSDQRQSGFHPFPPFRGRLPGIQSHSRGDIAASTRHFQRSGLQRNSFRLSGRRRRPLKGSPPSATQTERAVFPHSAFMNGFARSGEKGSVGQGYLVHQRVDLLLLTFERQMIG